MPTEIDNCYTSSMSDIRPVDSEIQPSPVQAELAKPAERIPDFRFVEKLSSAEKADVIRMYRVENILNEVLTQEHASDTAQGSIALSRSFGNDTLIITYSPATGFHDQWKPAATYQEVRERINAYGESVTQFFSHFPDDQSEPGMESISEKLRQAATSEPTAQELQQLPALMSADKRRKFIAETRDYLENNDMYVWSIPRYLEEAKKNPVKAGFIVDPQLEADIMREYHLKRRELDYAKLPKLRGDVMRKMDPFIDRIIESDDFLGEEHSELTKRYSGRAAMQALRLVQDYEPWGFDARDAARNRVSHFKYWRERALRWSRAAGIDISKDLEALAAQVREETREDLKPRPRKILDGLQRRFLGQVPQSRALIPKPELGQEDKEIEPAYQDDISVLIKTKNGRIIGAQLGNGQTNQDFRIVFPLSSFTKEEILAALAKTFPGAEVHHSTPDFLPTQEGRRSIRTVASNQEFEHALDEDKSVAVSDGKFAGIRIPLEKERPIGGSKVRALWLTVRDGEMYSFESDTLVSPDGPIEDYFFPHDSLNIKIEGEFNTTGTYVLGEGWILHPMYNPLTDAEWAEMHQKLGTILEHLLENGNVIDDSITSISIHPGWGSPMRPEEFTKKDGYRLEKVEQEITVEDVNHLKTKQKKTVDYPNWEAGKYVFQDGDNQFGIINRRGGGYLIKDLYTLVKFYPQGLHFNELSEEIERLRVM